MSSNSRRHGLFALLAVSALLAGCQGGPERPVERLAIVRLENLSPDGTLGWVGAALAIIPAERLTGSPKLQPQQVASVREATDIRATRVFDGYFNVANGEIEVHAQLRDAARNQVLERWTWTGPLPDGIPSIASRMTDALGDPHREFPSTNAEAIRAYAEGVVASAADEKETDFRRAIEADPSLVDASVALAQLLSLSDRPDEARELIEASLKRAGGDQIVRARLEYLRATLDQKPEEVVGALANYATLLPADAGLAERTAVSYLQLHDYAKASEWYGKAARLDPEQADLWNAQAYPRAYAGDFEGAVRSLERYGKGRPNSPNVADSLGEVNFRFGRYEAAERYFLATYDQAPDFQDGVALVKAARCRLMLGDLAGADRTLERYVASRREVNDPGVEFRRAQWQFWTGRRSEAVQTLLHWAGTEDHRTDLVALAHSQLALWAVLTGDRDRAEQHGEQARLAGGNRPPSGVSMLGQFLSRPPAGPDEWRERAAALLPLPQQEPLREEILIYPLLLSQDFKEAAPLIENSIRRKQAFQYDELDVALGWCRLEDGNLAEAARLLGPEPLVQPGNESPLYSFIFPKIFYLRGRLAYEKGDTEAAARNLKLFLEYSGDTPLVFGDEDKARQLLAKLGT